VLEKFLAQSGYWLCAKIVVAKQAVEKAMRAWERFKNRD